MAVAGDVRLERLSRYLFNAPSWPLSLLILVILGLIIDGASIRIYGGFVFLGTLGFTIPAIVAFLCTKPYINLFGKQMTWNRSGLLALACTVFSVIITLSAMIFSVSLIPLFFGISLGFISGIRLMVLVAISDYRVARMLIPALFQAATAIILGTLLFPSPFFTLAVVLVIVFVLMFILLLWLIERPLQRAFNIRVLSFLNAFIAHLTDGSKGMEDFFREIGEEVYVPQASLFFRKNGNASVIFTVPNVHPGPMGDIGGGNIPRCLHEAFEGIVMVPHGCATHDFNLVSEKEIQKIVAAMRGPMNDLTFHKTASRSERIQSGSVSLLVQRFGDALLIVSTRSPLRTEDLDFNIGMTIMAEGHSVSPDILFVDAHNCSTKDMTPVHPATAIAREYMNASKEAFRRYSQMESYPLRIGAAHSAVPYSREEGFGDQGIQVLAVSAGGQTTAYVLFDGNNIQEGVREVIRDRFFGVVDEIEVMTTDSHVVNTISGTNPVGLRVPVESLVPLVEDALNDALADIAEAEVAGSTVECEKIVIFGSQRIAQLASAVNAMLSLIGPISIALLLLAFLLSLIAYLVIT